MRTFIALELPDAFADDVAGMARVLSASVEGRFLGRDTYHVTLAFLGDITETEVSQAMDALDEACEHTDAIPLAPDGLGKFGRAADATLWLGLAKEEPLMALTENLREALRTRGLPFDDKVFLPHITLARRARLPKGPLPHLAFPLPTSAPAATLFKSTLDREGAIYKPLYSHELPRD